MKKYITFLGLALFFMSCSKTENPKESEEVKEVNAETTLLTLTNEQLTNLALDFTKLEHQNLTETIRLNARAELAPQHVVSITNPYGGYVKKIGLLPGNDVKKGQVVVILEDPIFIQMQEDYLTTKALLEQANSDYMRQRDLNAAQAASDKVMQQAKAAQQSLLIKKRALEDKLRLTNINPAQVSVNNIQRAVNIYSPINGVVSEIYANVGEYVPSTQPMLQIVNPNQSLLKIKVFEKDLVNLEIGQYLFAYTNNNNSKKLEAQITSISNQVNEDGTIDVFAKIIHLNGIRLTANMYFNVELTIKRSQLKSIKEDAVVEYDGKKFVFEKLSKNQYNLVPITTGLSSFGFVEVTSDLNPDKTYVTKGAFQLLTALKNSGEE